MEAGQDGATDILDLKDYITKANEQLQDNSFYQKLNVDPTAKHSEIVNSAIENLREEDLLSNSTARKCTLDDVKSPQFHILPKVHKPNIQERRIVISVECYASKMLKFVDHSAFLTQNFSRQHFIADVKVAKSISCRQKWISHRQFSNHKNFLQNALSNGILIHALPISKIFLAIFHNISICASFQDRV